MPLIANAKKILPKELGAGFMRVLIFYRPESGGVVFRNAVVRDKRNR